MAPLPPEWDDAQIEARLFQRVGDVVGVPGPVGGSGYAPLEIYREA